MIYAIAACSSSAAPNRDKQCALSLSSWSLPPPPPPPQFCFFFLRFVRCEAIWALYGIILREREELRRRWATGASLRANENDKCARSCIDKAWALLVLFFCLSLSSLLFLFGESRRDRGELIELNLYTEKNGW